MPILVNGRMVGKLVVGQNIATVAEAVHLPLPAAGGAGIPGAGGLCHPDRTAAHPAGGDPAGRGDRRGGGDRRGQPEGARARAKGSDDLGDLSKSFNKMADALERNDRERRDMLANIAHELRTPLTVVRGRLEGIMDGVYPADENSIGPALEESLPARAAGGGPAPADHGREPPAGL